MDLRKLTHAAKSTLRKNSDKIDKGIDQATNSAKSRFGQHSDRIDGLARKAKGMLVDEPRDQQAGGQPDRDDEQDRPDGRRGES
ncbi:antitoxin [Haloechinothrix sp. YIM 98757]|uniref:Antitoxin n=1 Tax=Haloechinothrix aidingensis TaxID=2752311 RepID=A0A838AD57_9PSEU|nr:antitoxin [Haloechinothrix aidingensis]MBA0127151.1 antitoxin [Haloechinothrix aidingensis]